jgi:hypothetical protein
MITASAIPASREQTSPAPPPPLLERLQPAALARGDSRPTGDTLVPQLTAERPAPMMSGCSLFLAKTPFRRRRDWIHKPSSNAPAGGSPPW